MARAYNATCLVIKHTKLGETDTIVTMLSDDGKQVRAVAKGLRKPGNRIGARLQLFSEVSLLLHAGKSLDIVTEARCVTTNAALRESLEHTASASVIAELLEKLGRDGMQLERRMYDMSTVAFELMAELPADRLPLIACAYLMKAMAMQGLSPAVGECALCGTHINEVMVFDVSYGGAICAQCRAELGIQETFDPKLASWVDALLHCTFSELASCEGAPMQQLLDLTQSWMQEHLAINLKSLTFLKSII